MTLRRWRGPYQGAGCAMDRPIEWDIDWLNEARDVLNARWNELANKYPEMQETISHELESNARDAIWALQKDEWKLPSATTSVNEASMTLEDAMDIVLLKCITAIDNNELNASQGLHSFLANQLHRNTLTVAACHLLAGMHTALSYGLPAEEATLTKQASGRPNKNRRDEMIRNFVKAELAARSLPGFNGGRYGTHKPTNTQVYREAARIFGVSAKTVQNICGS